MEIDVVGLQYLAGGVAESTLREELASLHKQQNRVVVDQSLDAFLGILRCFLTKVVEGHPSFGVRCGRRSSSREASRQGG